MNAIVIVPTYNERDNLASLIPAILEVDGALDILIVDDGSPDGTGELAESLAMRTDRVRVLQRGSKQGLGTAYIEGFRYALSQGYDYMIQMDADFSHRPKDLPLLLKAAEDADLVIGSRNVPGGRVENWSFVRRFISKGGSLYARTLLSLPIKDCTGGLQVLPSTRPGGTRPRQRALRRLRFSGRDELPVPTCGVQGHRSAHRYPGPHGGPVEDVRADLP